MVFWTSFSFQNKVNNFKHNDIYAECFYANSYNLSKTPCVFVVLLEIGIKTLCATVLLFENGHFC